MIANYYNTVYIDNLISLYYTNDQINVITNLLKTDILNTYNKIEINNLLTLKSDKNNSYTIEQIDNLLNLKGSLTDILTTTQIKLLLNLKADKETR